MGRVEVRVSNDTREAFARGDPELLEGALWLGNLGVVLPEDPAALKLRDEQLDDLYGGKEKKSGWVEPQLRKCDGCLHL